MFKKIIIYILCLLPWFLNNLIKVDYGFYKEINLPFFAPPNIFYAIAWTIIYILISYTVYSIVISYKFKDISKEYKITLLLNYISNQSYILVFFGLKSIFLGFVSCIITFITSLFLYEETSLLQSKKAKLLSPYILLSLFATILSLTIFLLNT